MKTPPNLNMNEFTEWSKEQLGGTFFGRHQYVWRESPGFDYLEGVWEKEWKDEPIAVTQGGLKAQVVYLAGDPELKVIAQTLIYPPKSNPDEPNILRWEFRPFCFLLTPKASEVFDLMKDWGAV